MTTHPNSTGATAHPPPLGTPFDGRMRASIEPPGQEAAWIVEKFRAWSDCGGDVEAAFTKDQLLANISLYWFTGAIGSSFWPYTRMHGPWPIPEGHTVDVPTGYCQFPAEILRPLRRAA